VLDQLDLSADTVHDECGVFGIFAPGESVAKLTYFGLYALQHRGQESAGIAVSDGENSLVFKDMGLVSQVFTETDLNTLQGYIAIGHVRYSTTGTSNWENSQPIHKATDHWSLSLAHNGNLINTNELRGRLEKKGIEFQSTSDSEVIAELIIQANKKTVEASVRAAVKRIRGAYSLVIMTDDKLIGVRDMFGVRPLALGQLNGNYVLSSETCGLDVIGAEFLREVLPGEMVVIDQKGLKSYRIFKDPVPSLCIFEFVYLARPDSNLYGHSVASVRKNMGRELAKEAPVEADLVIPVPDSGNAAAQGYAQESGIAYGEGFVKNRYIGRTFIQPSQTIRQQGIRLKLNPLKEVIDGKRLIVVDDSIVRGNTSKKIIQILKKAGAKEVHMRVSSPKIEWPCFYGIDTAERKDLIAANLSVAQIRDFLGADSLKYISHAGLVRAVGGPKSEFCMACFDGKYPIPIPQRVKITKIALEKAKKSETLF
jgi:amidophosphoribosyltransferase